MFEKIGDFFMKWGLKSIGAWEDHQNFIHYCETETQKVIKLHEENLKLIQEIMNKKTNQ